MDKLLRVLIIEDSEADALRILNELYRGGYDPKDERVYTADAVRKALTEKKWDLVISDFHMPGFTGLEALKIFKESGLDLPFILVSGMIGEERAVEALKLGAHDFISKNDLSRFLPAIRREIKEARLRNEQRGFQDALLRHEEVFRNIQIGLYIFRMEDSKDDRSLKLIDANTTAVNYLGVKELDIIGKQIYEIMPGLCELGVSLQFAQVVRTGESREFEVKYQPDRNSSEIYFTIKAFPLPDKCAGVAIENITERKKTESALRESEARFKTIASTANDAIVMIDNRGDISYWNPAAERIFGFESDEVYGKNVHRLIAPTELLNAHKENFPHFIETGEGDAVGKTLELTALRKDGKEFPVEVSLSSIKIKKRWHAVGIIRDISERKRLEVQLRQAHKMESIGTLAAGIAHEINTPTQFVGNNIRFLEDSFKDINEVLVLLDGLLELKTENPEICDKLVKINKALEDADIEFLREEIPKAIQQSKRGIENVSRIVSAMRSFAHPGTEQKKMADIHKALESTITVSRNEWKYFADLETHFDPDLPLIPCCVGEFNQVILNLIVNAAHAIGQVVRMKKDELNRDDKIEKSVDTDLKGLITITTTRKDDWAEIRISDTGIGIPAAVQDRVFEPFFTTKDVGEGTGQGLTLAHNVIVEKHGGTIRFDSQEGKGTTFIITLPTRID